MLVREEFQRLEPTAVSEEVIIKVFGVGGCGCNVLKRMASSGLQGMALIAANTNIQALAMAQADQTIKLGPDGLCDSGGSAYGRWAAEKSYTAIQEALGGAHLVFIVAGMGGRTGTGAAPVIAKAAKEAGALTVGIVTMPFLFEGKRRKATAEDGIEELCQQVDSLIVIPNERLRLSAPLRGSMLDLFIQVDGILAETVSCISALFTRPGLITLDFADAVSVLRGGGLAVRGSGSAAGENRARDAAMQALTCPLLDGASLRRARGVLFTITSGPHLSMTEVNYVHTIFINSAHEDATVIMTAFFDESLGDELRVNFIATRLGDL